MKIPQFSRRLAPALICLLMVSLAQAASPQTEWIVLSASGTVEFSHDQGSGLAWDTLVRGTRLPAAASVRTGADGRATLASGRSLILVDPDSSVEVPGRVSSRRPLRVYQESGSATYDIHKGRRHHFQVVTPYLVAGVKGTVFRVRVGEQATSVLVTEGVVEVFTLRDDLGVDVLAGQEAHLNALPGAVPRLAPAPTHERERLNQMSQVGRQHHQEARRDGTLPRPEPGWSVTNGYLARDSRSADALPKPEGLDEDMTGLAVNEKDDDPLMDDLDLARELDKEYKELEEERINQLLDPAQQVPTNQPPAPGTSR